MALRSVTVIPAFDKGSTTVMTMEVPFPKYGILKRVRIPATAGDTSATILIRDNGDVTNGTALLNVAAVDISSAYDKTVMFRGSSSAALGTASVNGENIGRGPLKARLTLAVGTTAPKFMQFIFEDPKYKETNLKFRSTGAQTATSMTTFVNLGADFATVKRIRYKSSADITVGLTVTDAYGYAVAAVAAGDFTTQQDKALIDVASVNDAGAVVASCVNLGVVARSPLKVVLDSLVAPSTFKTDFIVEA